MSLRSLKPIAILILVSVVGAILGCGGPSLPPPRQAPPDADEPATAAPPKEQAKLPEPEESSGSETPPPDESEPDYSAQHKLASVENLRTIGAAMLRYAEDNGGNLPSSSKFRSSLLSWRVFVLPYLGEQAMYQQFDLKSGAQANMKMLAQIPSAYRAPNVSSEKTAYLALGHQHGTYKPDGIARNLADITDGLDQTLILAEVQGRLAPRWFYPEEIDTDHRQFSTKNTLQSWDDDGFLALTASGAVVQIKADISIHDFRKLLTYDKGDDGAAVMKRWAKPIAGALPGSPATFASTSGNGGASIVANGASSSSGSGLDSGAEESGSGHDNNVQGGSNTPLGYPFDGNEDSDSSQGTKRAVPSEPKQKEAMKLVKELFLDRYQDATSRDEKVKIAREMLTKSSQLGDDIAGRYVMLSTAQRVALEVDDIETADKALDEMLENWDLDAYELKVELMKKTASLSQKNTFDTRIMDESWDLALEAVKRDDYATAKDMTETALAAARRLNDKDRVSTYSRGLFELEKMQASFKRVSEALANVGDASEDPKISELVGRYYCFMKDDWDAGLQHLANAQDADLRRLAQRELEKPVDPDVQLEIADGWWEESKRSRAPEDKRIGKRALHWYQTALKSLPKGLPRLKAELRVKEIKSEIDEG